MQLYETRNTLWEKGNSPLHLEFLSGIFFTVFIEIMMDQYIPSFTFFFR